MRYRLSLLLKARADEQKILNQEQEKGWLSLLHEMFPKNLKLIIMSATLDPIALAKLFPNNMFEVFLMPRRNIENQHQRIIKHIRQPIKAIEYQNLVLQTVLNIHYFGQLNHDILVFFHGEREIKEFVAKLNNAVSKIRFTHHHQNKVKYPWTQRKLDIFTVYSAMSTKMKEKLTTIAQKNSTSIREENFVRRCYVATNMAEASITIENIGYVIDSGKAKVARFSYSNNSNSLEKLSISKASALQRAGRTGRTNDGLVLRFYTLNEYLDFQDEMMPPLLLGDFTNTVITLMQSFIPINQLHFLHEPTSDQWNAVFRKLFRLNIISFSPTTTMAINEKENEEQEGLNDNNGVSLIRIDYKLLADLKEFPDQISLQSKLVLREALIRDDQGNHQLKLFYVVAALCSVMTVEADILLSYLTDDDENPSTEQEDNGAEEKRFLASEKEAQQKKDDEIRKARRQHFGFVIDGSSHLSHTNILLEFLWCKLLSYPSKQSFCDNYYLNYDALERAECIFRDIIKRRSSQSVGGDDEIMEQDLIQNLKDTSKLIRKPNDDFKSDFYHCLLFGYKHNLVYSVEDHKSSKRARNIYTEKIHQLNYYGEMLKDTDLRLYFSVGNKNTINLGTDIPIIFFEKAYQNDLQLSSLLTELQDRRIKDKQIRGLLFPIN
mmetsp:Transcript_30279/g.34941  ORF Transcript_30279/g.34941 Transcript_30279/m.34941 type:complete len:663 (+) Transcript_30279:261-2249(+)